MVVPLPKVSPIMETPKLKHTLKEISQAPRDQLDRCVSLLRICMEAKKAANVLEDGVVSSKKMEKADSLVDQICEYVKLVADPNRAAIREEDWKSVQQKAVEPVLSDLPKAVARSMRSELENAAKNDKNTTKLLVKVKERIQELVKKDRITIKLSFLTADTDPNEVEYEVKSHTPPSGLAMTVLFHRKQGRLPSFYHYHLDPELLINRPPADWTLKDIPDRLFVVMDRGRLEFKFKITSLPTITNTWVFRNIFVLQTPERFYLKDSSGILHPAPDGDLIPDRIACYRVQRPDQKRIEGPIPCKQWRETLRRIITAGDDDWIVEPEPPPPPDSASPNFVLDLPTLTQPVGSDTKAACITAPPFGFPTASQSSTSNVKESDAIPGGHTITRTPSPSASVPPGANSSIPHNPPGSVVALNPSTSSSSTQDSSTHQRDPLGDTTLTPPTEEKVQTGLVQKVFNWARKKISDKRRRS